MPQIDIQTYFQEYFGHNLKGNDEKIHKSKFYVNSFTADIPDVHSIPVLT